MNYKVKVDGKEVDRFIVAGDIKFTPSDTENPEYKKIKYIDKMVYEGTISAEFSNSFMKEITKFKSGFYTFRKNGRILVYVFLEEDEVMGFIQIMGNPNKTDYMGKVSGELLHLVNGLELSIVMQGEKLKGNYELHYEGTKEEIKEKATEFMEEVVEKHWNKKE